MMWDIHFSINIPHQLLPSSACPLALSVSASTIMGTKYYDKNVQWRSGLGSTAVFSAPLVHNPMPASHIYLSNGIIEKDRGYEGWLASKQSIYAPERAFMEAGSNEKVFHAGEATQGYSNMRRAPREVEEIMIIRNPALSVVVYDDEKMFPAAEAANGYPHMRQAVRGKDENMFGRNTMSSEGDQSSNKISSTEAIYEFLNTRQAARWKEENKPASNTALSDSEYGRNTYSPRAGRGHMNMKMDQDARQKEHTRGPSSFLSDDGHNRDMYPAEAGRGYTIIRQGARLKEDMNPSSSVIDDDEYHQMYSPEAGREYTIVTKTTRKKVEAIFALNPVLCDDDDDDEYSRMVFVKPPIMEFTNKRKAVTCGPWGGSSGDLFDDGVFTGIREIELTRTGCIISIKVCYDMDGKAVWGNRNGGDHGIKVDKIVLDYPSEYLTHISGYYGSTVLRGPTVVKSLTFHTNRRKFGPFGDQQGVSFSSAGSVEGKIVGFSGRIKGWYVTSIGVHVMEGKPPQPPAQDLLSMIGMRMCEAGTREPDQWYAKKVYMTMANK